MHERSDAAADTADAPAGAAAVDVAGTAAAGAAGEAAGAQVGEPSDAADDPAGKAATDVAGEAAGAKVGEPSDAADPAEPVRRLILLRHAKSGYPEGVADHDRPLAPRGRREAVIAGEWIVRTQPPVEVVLCSDARRTRETLRRSGIAAPVRIRPALYGAVADEILRELTGVAAGVRTVLVVAHSPGIPQAAAALAGPGSDPAALASLRSGFPTSALAVLDVPRPWDELAPARCRLLTVHVPRN